MLKDPQRVCVEAGPGRTLQALAFQQRERGSRQEIVALLPDLRDRRSCGETLAAAMGRLWIAGADIDWTRYYEGETRNRVHLPTYPFERERHWIDPPAAAAIAHDASPQDAIPEDIVRRDFSEWFYVPIWKQAPAPPVPGYDDCTRTWLIVGDESGLAPILAAALSARGQAVTVCAVDDVPARGVPDRVIVFPAGFGALRRIIQTLAERIAGRSLVLDVVQTGVQSVTGDERLQPENASVLGLCRVVSQEIPEIRCRHIDLVTPGHDADRIRAVDQLVHELAIETQIQTAEIAYRGRFRWTLDYDRVKAPAGRSPLLRERGVYWITGGTGGVGLALAEYLAATRQARLVLTSRRTLPSGDPRRERIRRMEELGSDVLVIQADASNPEAMLRAAGEVQARFGEVHGAIHAAGVPGGRLIALQTEEGAHAVMSPKTRGAINLEQALGRFRPDFVLYCSSLAVQIGGLGQADYAGANAFLDALARERSSRGGRLTVSVNWDRWRHVGMAVGMAAGPGGAEGIDPEEGARALEVILGWAFPQVALSAIDLRSRVIAGAGRAHAAAAELHPRPRLSTDYVTPATGPEAALAALWGEILGLGQVGIDDNFFELGGDSLNALRFTALYKERVNVSLPVTALYGAPTIRRLLASVAETAGSRTAAVPAEPARERASANDATVRLKPDATYDRAI